MSRQIQALFSLEFFTNHELQTWATNTARDQVRDGLEPRTRMIALHVKSHMREQIDVAMLIRNTSTLLIDIHEKSNIQPDRKSNGD